MKSIFFFSKKGNYLNTVHECIGTHESTYLVSTFSNNFLFNAYNCTMCITGIISHVSTVHLNSIPNPITHLMQFHFNPANLNYHSLYKLWLNTLKIPGSDEDAKKIVHTPFLSGRFLDAQKGIYSSSANVLTQIACISRTAFCSFIFFGTMDSKMVCSALQCRCRPTQVTFQKQQHCKPINLINSSNMIVWISVIFRMDLFLCTSIFEFADDFE